MDFARDTQILDGIIPGKAEGCYIVNRNPIIVVQRMAVTIEMSSECESLCWTYEVFCIDVGIEAAFTSYWPSASCTMSRKVTQSASVRMGKK